MNDDDAALLHRYATEGSQAAFTELVRRHVNLVYGAALRRTGSPERATEVAQQVFTQLARQARKLAQHAVLAGWLHTATRNAALNLMISEQRRQAREHAAMVLHADAGDPPPDWERLHPVLDAAIDELPETDRAAVVLRFLEQRPFGEIGAALRISEDAARMRTERALDKMRAVLARRGITSTSAALALAVASQPLLAAPAGLATVLAAHALAAGSAGSLATTLASFMTTKTILAATLSALVAFSAGAYFHPVFDRGAPVPTVNASAAEKERAVAAARPHDDARLSATIDGLNEEVRRLKEINAELSAKLAARPPLAAAGGATVRRKSPNIGGTLYELQGAVMNNLRQIEAARAQYQLEKGRPAESIYDLVGVDRYIKTVRTVGGEDYAELAMIPGQPLTVVTPDGVSVTYDPAGVTTTKIEVPPAILRLQELGKRLQAPATKAVEAYRAAHNGSNPASEEAILPYFATPQEGADYVEFMAARKSAGR